jgi:hypothetical protein
MQEKDVRRSIMLTGEVHASLSGLCGHDDVGCTHSQAVDALVQLVEGNAENWKEFTDCIKQGRDAQMAAKRRRQELNAKISLLSDDEIAKLMENIG